MYECSICHAPVEIDHINPPVKSCECSGTIVAVMGAGLAGKGELNAVVSNGLSNESMAMLRAMLPGIAAIEFFRDGKKEISLDQEIVDEQTGRKFNFKITGVEL